MEGVQRLVGKINYLARYRPNFSDMSEPLQQITRSGIEWQWTDHHKKALQNIKAAITKAPVLKYFDPTAATVLRCDASKTGVAAVLLQDGQACCLCQQSPYGHRTAIRSASCLRLYMGCNVCVNTFMVDASKSTPTSNRWK